MALCLTRYWLADASDLVPGTLLFWLGKNMPLPQFECMQGILFCTDNTCIRSR